MRSDGLGRPLPFNSFLFAHAGLESLPFRVQSGAGHVGSQGGSDAPPHGNARVVLGILLVFLVSCGTGHDADEKYYLISNNIKIPYWQAGGAGLFQAAAQLKVRSEFAGPDTYDAKAEQQAFQQAVQSKASGILVSVADPALMKDDIDRAIAAGIR